MSLDATIWAWKHNLKPSKKLILLSLADRADDNNSCFPSISRLELDTGLNRKTIMKSLSEMQADGLIISDKSNGRVNRYTLVGVQKREDKAVPKTGQVVKQQPVPKVVQGSTKSGTSTSTKSGTLTSQYNLSITSKEYKGFDFSSWPDMPNEQIMNDWFAMRKRKKADVSQTVVNTFGKELSKAAISGITVNQCLESCITRGWQGFKSEWMENNKGGNNETNQRSNKTSLAERSTSAREQWEKANGYTN